MTSKISLNIHGNNVRNVPALKTFLGELQPTTLFVLDSLGLARELKALLPNTTVIFREYEGGGQLHKNYTAQEWLNVKAYQAAGGLYLNVMNEPAFDREVLAWLVELMKLAAPRGIHLVIGNWGVGNPQPDAWPQARELLQLLNQHRDLFILGLHEYAGGIITSGLVGGNPTMIKPESWPTSIVGITCWHMGRFKFLLDYCNSAQIRAPRIVLTEHGFDDTSDIKPWLDSLIRAAMSDSLRYGLVVLGLHIQHWLQALRKSFINRWNKVVVLTGFNALYFNIRGWKTLRNQWAAWFPNWSPERAYFEQLKWASEVIYRNSPVEGQCIFCYGHSSMDWEQFDIEDAGELKRLLEEYAKSGTAWQPSDNPPPPAPLPPPIAEPELFTLLNGPINLREGKSVSSRILASVARGTTVGVYSEPAQSGGFYKWYRVRVSGVIGYMALLAPTFEQQFQKVMPKLPFTVALDFSATEASANMFYGQLKSLLSVYEIVVGPLTRK